MGLYKHLFLKKKNELTKLFVDCWFFLLKVIHFLSSLPNLYVQHSKIVFYLNFSIIVV